MYTPRLSHVKLKIRDLDQSAAFYTRFLNLRVVERVDDHVFLSGSEAHHEIVLQAIGPDAPSPSPGSTGLHHIALEVPDGRSLALAYRALTEAGLPVSTFDHRISWVMYFHDPDGNQLELFWDRRDEPGGHPLWRGQSAPLPEAKLLAALNDAP